jgi:hypothetical protein
MNASKANRVLETAIAAGFFAGCTAWRLVKSKGTQLDPDYHFSYTVVDFRATKKALFRRARQLLGKAHGYRLIARHTWGRQGAIEDAVEPGAVSQDPEVAPGAPPAALRAAWGNWVRAMARRALPRWQLPRRVLPC